MEEKVAIDVPLLDKKDFISSTFGKRRVKPDDYCHLATAVIRSSVIAHLDEEYTLDLDDTAVLWWAMNYGKRYYDHQVAYAYVKHKGSVFSEMERETFLVRTLLSADVLNCQWNNKYKRYTRKKWKNSFLELYSQRYELTDMVDYDTWYPCAVRYKGWTYELMNYVNEKSFARRKTDIKACWFKVIVYGSRLWAYGKECVSYLCDTKIPVKEKIKKFSHRQGM